MLLNNKNNKKLLITLLICVCGIIQIQAQSNKAIAYSYIKKANAAIENSIDYAEALINFNKAMEYMDVITDRKVASLGARSYYEIHHKQRTLQRQIHFLEISNKYSKQYFALAKNKNSDEYQENLELYSHAKRDLAKLKYALRKKRMTKF